MVHCRPQTMNPRHIGWPWPDFARIVVTRLALDPEKTECNSFRSCAAECSLAIAASLPRRQGVVASCRGNGAHCQRAQSRVRAAFAWPTRSHTTIEVEHESPYQRLNAADPDLHCGRGSKVLSAVTAMVARCLERSLRAAGNG